MEKTNIVEHKFPQRVVKVAERNFLCVYEESFVVSSPTDEIR